MKRFRTIPLLSFAAILAVALAAPALASAAEWTNEGEPLSEEVKFDVNGSLGWSIPGLGASLTCSQVEGEVTLYPGDEGEMVTQVIDPQGDCVMTGYLAGCIIPNSVDPVTWSLHAQEEDIVATDVKWLWDLEGEQCFADQDQIGFEGDLTLTPDRVDAMTSWTISGQGLLLPWKSAVFNGGGVLGFESSAAELYGLSG